MCALIVMANSDWAGGYFTSRVDRLSLRSKESFGPTCEMNDLNAAFREQRAVPFARKMDFTL